MAPNYDDDDIDDVEEDEDEEEDEEDAPKKRRRAGKHKDPNKPKRNMSAFFLYSQAFRAQVKEENPDAAFGDIVSHSTAV